MALGVEVGFYPDLGVSQYQQDRTPVPQIVTGTIVYVNAEHRWCDVERHAPGGTYRISFKF